MVAANIGNSFFAIAALLDRSHRQRRRLGLVRSVKIAIDGFHKKYNAATGLSRRTLPQLTDIQSTKVAEM